MKNFTTYLRGLICVGLFLIFSNTAKANHLVGMDLFYTHQTGNTYKVTLIAYANCGSAGPGSAYDALPTNTPQVYVYNAGSLITTLTLHIEAPTAGVEITPVCPADLLLTQCTDVAYSTPGIKKFVFSTTYTVPSASQYWRFLFTGNMGTGFIAGRAIAITNISSTPDTYIQLVDTLNNLYRANSSPNLSVIPTPFFCENNTDNYNPGAIDADADSLTFFLVPAMAGTTTSTPGGMAAYIPPYTGTNPLQVTTSSFNASNGQITFYPNALQRSVVVYNIEEHQGDTLMGTSQREMTFLVLVCTNTPASGGLTGASAGVIVDSTHFKICQNTGAFTISINPTEPITTNNITVTTAGLPTGSTFTTTGNGTPTPHCTFTWTSTGVTPGTYTFFVTYTDNNCPLAGQQTIAYNISILAAPTVATTLVSAASCVAKAAVTITPAPAGGGPWTVKVSDAPGDTIQTFPGVTAAFLDSLVPGNFTITIFNSSGCSQFATITITAPPPIIATATFTNPSYCGATDGTITIHGLTAGAIDTIKYSFNGVAQPPSVRTVAAGGIVTLTGLIAGLYTNITATYGHCVSTDAGPVTLINPPFTMRALTFTNPSWCGNCDGTITIYGLHPGQTDTLNYTLGGIAQPAVVRAIGADSMITLTGLCVGTYANFISKTSGVCLSNMLGPVVLTAPPVTIRAITSTNPSWCGFCDGTITLYGLHPGQTDTIKYNLGGIPQPPIVRLIGADSMVVLTGMCQGTYANFVAIAGTCVSNTVGPVTLTVPPFTMRAITFTNPVWCGDCNGTITLYGLHPGQTDTITYTLGGVAQPPVVRTIGADSMVILTGMCQGTYANFIAKTAGVCVSNTLGPVTLVVPPFVIRAISFTNPEWCGICNGTITLYGLHPGDVDTISFTRGGVPQPPVVYTIGADSQVVLTGMCNGTYANFIATKASGCVSNAVGPVVLTVPPFVIRAISSTNPSWCGNCDGTITLYGLHPGQTDSINYTLGGVPQPPIVRLIGADSQVVLTGMCQGIYANFIATTLGLCTSNAVGPVTLTPPPFTVRAATSTNPDYCGICNGTITLYGLHPGDIDTVKYTYAGLVVNTGTHTIGVDSTVTITGLCAGAYTNIFATKAGGCVTNSLGPVTLTVPPFTMRALTSTNPDYCGICNGTITLYGIHPGQLDTITYTYNGAAQPQIMQVIPTDSMVTLTGLCAGLYDNFIAHTAETCISNTLGPANLTVPPFTIRALSQVNPAYCGICNGSITIYGVHPGQNDTITYTYNGVAQTPVVALIPTDSTVTITGLCQGVYDNFVVKTAGVCVSNTLGPVTLTVPPFTISYLTYSNPTKCGFCDGIIHVHGLYPGQVDTLYYRWNGVQQTPIRFIASTDSVATIPGLCKGTYDSFIVRTGSCVSNVLGPVTLVDPPIIAAFDTSIHLGCKGDTVFLTNNSFPASDLTYHWNFGDGLTDISTDPSHVYYLPGNYIITLVITNTRCYDSTKKTISLDNLIKAGFTSTPDSFVCQDSLVRFTNTSLGTSMAYTWLFGDGSTSSLTNPGHAYANTGHYEVILAVTNYVPCFDTVSKYLTVDSTSEISITATDTVICREGYITFTGNYAAMGNTGVQWTFSNGYTKTNLNPVEYAFEAAGVYTITLQSFYRACPTVSSTKDVRVYANPQVDLGNDTSICPGSDPILLIDRQNTGNTSARWHWNTGQTTSFIEVGSPGYYVVKVTIDGCSSVDSIEVKNDCYMNIPNVFTPNGDGVNDYFYPRQYLTKGLTEFSMTIYNRWGQEIFTTNTLDGRGWDGNFNNTPQPEGVYIYIINATFKDGQKEKHQGNITLLR